MGLGTCSQKRKSDWTPDLQAPGKIQAVTAPPNKEQILLTAIDHMCWEKEEEYLEPKKYYYWTRIEDVKCSRNPEVLERPEENLYDSACVERS